MAIRARVGMDGLTIAEAAAEVRVSPITIRLWVRSGGLPATQLASGHFRILREDMEAALAALLCSRLLNGPLEPVARQNVFLRVEKGGDDGSP